MNTKNDKARLQQLREKERKVEKWLAEFNQKQKTNISENELIHIEKPKKDNFDKLIGCGG